MMKTLRNWSTPSRLAALAVWALLSHAAAADDAQLAQAKKFFATYQQLEREFDPKAADLYSDTAEMHIKRIYPNGQSRVMTMQARAFKDLIRKAMPLAKLRKDTSKYSDVSYTPEGGGVRIKSMRYSNLKKYESPHELLIKPDDSGGWLIHEELAESRVAPGE